MPETFVVQITQRLREQDPAVMPVTAWLEAQLAKQNTNIEQVIHGEHQRQAATQVTVGNIITSMRLLSTLDWRDFFESVSLIEPVLGQDPAGAYLKMDFAARDRYRHVIERISKRALADELAVARAAIKLAAQERVSESGDEATYRAHVGYYLVDNGLHELEQEFGYRPLRFEYFRRYVLGHPTFAYLGTMILLTALLLTLLGGALSSSGTGWPVLLIALLLALVPASDIAITIINWDVTHLFEPRFSPRWKLREAFRTALLPWW